MDLDELAKRFAEAVPEDVDFSSIRYVETNSQSLEMRQGVLAPPVSSLDRGVMITIHDGGGLGYGATSDLTSAGLARAAARAKGWAQASAALAITDFSAVAMPSASGGYRSNVLTPWASVPLSAKLELLSRVSADLKSATNIVDYAASLWNIAVNQRYVASNGARIDQEFSFLFPMLSATAHKAGESQSRSFGGYGNCRQGGFELLDELGMCAAAQRVADEACQLLAAPNCPAGRRALLIAPDQMILQIHESIGHPLELDRILGDERNYAGTSFVTSEMFGTYQYGSELLNISYDPSIQNQVASYGFDDDGLRAEKAFVIKDGLLVRPLGGVLSQARANLPGVANVRSESWNRPPIDRMANLNLEPGSSSLKDMIASTELGLYVKTNCSWSIDDSRNKFQFGCEWGQLIENGELTTVVKNANYRGISATFWRNLAMVGGPETLAVLGTPFCGKGEPNQVVRVGHASPACLFTDVDVFGGA